MRDGSASADRDGGAPPTGAGGKSGGSAGGAGKDAGAASGASGGGGSGEQPTDAATGSSEDAAAPPAASDGAIDAGEGPQECQSDKDCEDIGGKDSMCSDAGLCEFECDRGARDGGMCPAGLVCMRVNGPGQGIKNRCVRPSDGGVHGPGDMPDMPDMP